MAYLRLSVLCVTSLFLICHIQAAEQIQVFYGWAGGMTGAVTIHSDHIIHGWKIHLMFDFEYQSITTAFGTATRLSAHEWTIDNTSWDSYLSPGSPITVTFVAAMGDGGLATSGHAGTYTLEVITKPHSVTALPSSTKRLTTTTFATTTVPSSSTKHVTTTPIVSTVKTTTPPPPTKHVTQAPSTTTTTQITALPPPTKPFTTMAMFTATSAPAHAKTL